MDDKKKKLLSADGELMRALGITEEDIAANEDGRITPGQIEVIKEMPRYQKISELILGFIFGLIGTGALVAATIELVTRPGQVGADLGMGLFGAIFLAIAFGFIWSRKRTRDTIAYDVLDNRIATTQGIAVVTHPDDNAAGYLEINDQRFEVSDDALKRIRHLEPYLIHFLEESKIVIAMQHMDAEDDNIK